MQKPTIKASKKPFKNKSSLLKKRETGTLLPQPTLFLPELKENTSPSKLEQKILDPASTNKGDASKNSSLNEKIIKQFVKNIFNTTTNYNNSYPKAFSTTNVKNVSNSELNGDTNVKNVSNSELNGDTNVKNVSNSESNDDNSTRQILNNRQNNTLNQLENKFSDKKSEFITVENSKISNNNSVQDLKNYNDSHFTSLVRNMIQPESTKVYVNGKERHVDSTKIKERIKEQAGVVPMFAMGGMITKPTLGLLGEKGPEMVTPIAASKSAVGTPSSTTAASKSAVGTPSSTTMTPDVPSPASISNQSFSSNMINKQSAQNLIQGNNTTNISNSNNIAKTQSFSEYNQTLSNSTNVSTAVKQLETKTDKIIKEIGKPKNEIVRESDVAANQYTAQSPGPGPQAVGQESGVSEGPAKEAFNRFFTNQTFSVPEWRQRMG